MKAEEYAEAVNRRLAVRSGYSSALPELTHLRLLVYAALMHLTLPRAEQDAFQMYPHMFVGYPCYTVEFCHAEQDTLADLGITPSETEALVNEITEQEDGAAEKAYGVLYNFVYGFMPPWRSNIKYGPNRGRLPVYSVLLPNEHEVCLVNEALVEAFDTPINHNYPIPLRELLYGTWRRFDTFPNPYDRRRGTVERRAAIQ